MCIRDRRHLPRPGYLLAESYSADVAARILAAAVDARVSGLPVSLEFKMDRDGEQERYYEARLASINAVSYTHLDVYKIQSLRKRSRRVR